jgi:hypothetical protein
VDLHFLPAAGEVVREIGVDPSVAFLVVEIVDMVCAFVVVVSADVTVVAVVTVVAEFADLVVAESDADPFDPQDPFFEESDLRVEYVTAYLSSMRSLPD